MQRITFVPILIAAMAALLSLQSCNDDRMCVRASGPYTDRVVELNSGTVRALELAGPIDVQIVQDTFSEVIIRAQGAVHSALENNLYGDVLEVGFRNGSCVKGDADITLFLTTPDLYSINISGASNIRSVTPLDLDRLDIHVSGVADIDLHGSITDYSIDASGSVDAGGFDLVTEKTVLEISGAGRLDLTCTSELTVSVSGSAAIRYKGAPTIEQSVSGALDLINAN